MAGERVGVARESCNYRVAKVLKTPLKSHYLKGLTLDRRVLKIG